MPPLAAKSERPHAVWTSRQDRKVIGAALSVGCQPHCCQSISVAVGRDPTRNRRSAFYCRSAKPGFCELKCYKAAFGDLTQPAITGRSVLQMATRTNGR